MDTFEITVEESDIDKRIDLFLAGNLESFSRSYIQDLIKKGKATISGKPVKANYRLIKNHKLLKMLKPTLKTPMANRRAQCILKIIMWNLW